MAKALASMGPLDEYEVMAITEAGAKQYASIVAAVKAKLAAGDVQASYYDDDDDDQVSTNEPRSRLLRIEGTVGIVSIKGPLVNSDSFWNQIFGLVSYNSIRNALIEAATHPKIKGILLDIDSPGGAVSGLDDTGEMIAMIDTQVKPVYSYSDGQMCSAAYWLGCSAREIHAGETSMVGSIGCVTTLVEYSKAMADAGINAKVIRSGKYKMLGGPNEPLSDLAIEETQRMIDDEAAVFEAHVAEHRHKPVSYVHDPMGQGRVFVGESAKNVGLIDNISGFEDVLAVISAKTFDNSGFSYENNNIGATMKNNNKQSLASAVRAQLIAAGHLSADSSSGQPVGAAAAVVAAAAEAAAAAAAGEARKTGADNGQEDVGAETVAPAGETSDPAVVQATLEVSEDSSVKLLKEQIRERDGQLIDAKVENKSLTQQLEALRGAMEGFKAIAVKSIGAMSVALNRSAVDCSDMPEAQVLKLHESLSADFASTFKVGGVAAISQENTTSDDEVRQTNLRKAQLAAARL